MKHDRTMDTRGKGQLPTEEVLLQCNWNGISNAIQADFANHGSRMLIKEAFELFLPVIRQILHMPRMHAKARHHDKRQRLLGNRCRFLPVVRLCAAGAYACHLCLRRCFNPCVLRRAQADVLKMCMRIKHVLLNLARLGQHEGFDALDFSEALRTDGVESVAGFHGGVSFVVDRGLAVGQ